MQKNPQIDVCGRALFWWNTILLLLVKSGSFLAVALFSRFNCCQYRCSLAVRKELIRDNFLSIPPFIYRYPEPRVYLTKRTRNYICVCINILKHHFFRRSLKMFNNLIFITQFPHIVADVLHRKLLPTRIVEFTYALEGLDSISILLWTCEKYVDRSELLEKNS